MYTYIVNKLKLKEYYNRKAIIQISNVFEITTFNVVLYSLKNINFSTSNTTIDNVE